VALRIVFTFTIGLGLENSHSLGIAVECVPLTSLVIDLKKFTDAPFPHFEHDAMIRVVDPPIAYFGLS
jgi:hypothetical protein